MKKSLPQKIASQIIRDFNTLGETEAGRKLPTQSELQKKYYISRTTVIKALDILKQENIIYSVQGKGMFFVGDRLPLYLSGVYSYDYQLRDFGIEIKNILINGRLIPANKHLAQIFDIEPETPVIEIIRKKVDAETNEDLIIQCNYLLYQRFQTLDFEKLHDNRLYVVLSNDFGLNLTRASEQIMLSEISSKYARHIDTKHHQVLRIDRIGYESDVVVEYTNTYLLSSNFKYNINLNM